MRYRIHLPTDRDVAIDDECESCKISIQMIYDGGYSWLGIGLAGAVDSGSPMIGGHAIVGQPGISDPATFYLGGKSSELVRRTELHVGESNIDFIGGRTVMDFTIAFSDWRGEENLGLRLHSPSNFIWAHGRDGETELSYHGPNNKSTFTITNLLDSQSNDESSSEENEGQSAKSMSRTSKSMKSAWVAHGIMAFLAFGMLVPAAISSALLRDCTLPTIFGHRLEDIRSKLLTKYWLYIHMVFNSTAAAFTVIVFSVAVSNINREGGYSHWMSAHAKMGLAIFILVLCQVSGGYLRPSAAPKAISGGRSNETVDDELIMTEDDKGGAQVEDGDIIGGEIHNNEEEDEEKEVRTFPSKSVIRQTWELFHHILGIALFLFGVWQMYEGIELYHGRYNNASFSAIVVLYFLWMALWICIIGGAFVYKWFFLKQGVASGRGKGASSESNFVTEKVSETIESDNDAAEKSSDII